MTTKSPTTASSGNVTFAAKWFVALAATRDAIGRSWVIDACIYVCSSPT